MTVDEIIARRRKQQSISNQADERRPSESETADNETEPEDNENEVDTDEDEDQSDEDSVPDAGGSDDEEEQPLLESESSSSEADENDVEDATLQEMAEYVSPFTALANAGQSLSDVEDDSENKQDVKAVEYFTAAPLTSTSKITTNDALRSSSLPPFSALPGAKISRPILLGLQSLGLTTPTPVQAQTIPVAMTGKDIVGSSITGSGKTVAFWVGVLERQAAWRSTVFYILTSLTSCTDCYIATRGILASESLSFARRVSWQYRFTTLDRVLRAIQIFDSAYAWADCQ